jgi:hypothetical protein
MREELKQYFELVFPQKALSAWERLIFIAVYIANNCVSDEAFTIKLGKLAELSGGSETSVRQYIRSLGEKKIIQVSNFSRHGYSIIIQPPNAIPGISVSETLESAIEVEKVDFFKGRRFVRALLERQGGQCFYSLRTLDEQTCELDHLQPQANALDNSYRNIVCCSFEMNKRKGDTPADAFLRQLYRSGFLSAEELDERPSLFSRIKSGELKPKI